MTETLIIMAVQAMETVRSRCAAAALAACAVGLAGCGGGAAGRSHPAQSARWPTFRIPDGASMTYPPGWARVHSDPGTATAALVNRHHQFLGYLNITPQQGAETVSNWPAFRPHHDMEEGDRHLRTLEVQRDRRFRTGRGTCVRESYTTQSKASYIELACIVAGRRATTVAVGAAPPGAWKRISPLLERAISSLTT